MFKGTIMVDKTIADLIVDIESELYQVAGISTQVYAQDMLMRKIINAYLMIATDPEFKWKRFRTTTEYTLDGTTGRTTADVSLTYRTFDDIYSVFPENSNEPLKSGGVRHNLRLITGTTPQIYVPDSVGIIRIVPTTAVGKIIVVGRYLPKVSGFTLGDTIPFDYLAIVYFVCWQSALDDGANPAMAEKFQQLYENRIKQLRKGEQEDPIPLNISRLGLPLSGGDIGSGWFS